MKKNSVPLEKLIHQKLNEFTATEKKIAAYFLDEKNEIAFLSIHDLAVQLDVGRASILRFANKIGYKGFLQLKKDISQKIQEDIAPLERFQLMLDKSVVGFNTINQIAENEVNNINALINNYDETALKKAIELIQGANIVYSMGIDLSSFVAGITSYLLQRIGTTSFPVTLGGLSFLEQLININKNDVLIAFSFPPYSPETIEAAKFTKKQNGKIIAFTNSLTAPIAQFSDVVFKIKTESVIFANSLSSSLVLIYSLVNEIAAKDKNRSMSVINKMISER